MIGLHRHSHYSKRDAIAKIPDIVKRTAQLGQSAWALTDHGTTSGLPEAYSETLKFNQEHGTDIKFIFGVEAYWIPDYFIKDRKLSRHIILLAKNQIGYRNLLKLVTIGYGDKGKSPENFYHTMRLTTDTIAQYHEGLIVTSACRGGILQDRDYAVDRAKNFKDIFADDFYLEIQAATDPDQHSYNLYVLELATRLDIPVIVSEDSHYVYKTDADIHRKWLQLGDNSDYYATDDFYIHSDIEIRQALSYVSDIDDIIKTTEAVADKCAQVHIDFGKKHFPRVEILNLTPKQAVCQLIKHNVKHKLLDRKSKAEIDKCRELVRHELDVLQTCDYLNYFLINAALIKHCREAGIHIGRGRGSVCGSLVAYLLDITRVDPTVFDLFFERFANPERVSPPDIDTDVPNSKRDAVIQYLKDTYHEVFRVRTFGTMGDKAAIQRAAASLDLPVYKRKMLSNSAATVDDVFDSDLRNLASNFLGIIQQFGIHASALIIFPDDAEEFCAIERQGGEYVCAYQFPELERMGLLKLDILGMKTLDTIDDAVKLIKLHHGVDIDLDNLSFDDKKTFDMLNSGDTLGCFQIESSGMIKLIKQLKPQSLFELIPIVALYRPSTIQSGVLDDFIARAKSKSKKIDYIHPKLAPILKDTFGILLYQEQAMQIVQTIAGYSLAKADVFRRAIGHKDNAKMQELIAQFVNDGQANGVDKDTMLKLADWLRNCASYQFNKSHSAAYALLSYQTAYLKAHFPVEFLTAYLNSHHDDKQDDLLPYVLYARNSGIKFLPPDASSNFAGWHVKNNSIVTAVNFIKGVGNIDLPIDRQALARLPKNKIAALIKAGALSYLGSRQQLVDDFLQDTRAKRREAQELCLFGEHQSQKPRGDYDSLIYTDPAQLQAEVLGFSFDSPFNGIDTSRFVEPDFSDKNIRVVLCVIRRFSMLKNGSASICIETPSGNTFNIFMPSSRFSRLNEGDVCALSLQKNTLRRLLRRY